MIGIQAIASEIPPGRIDNRELLEKFDVDEDFLRRKTGPLAVARKGPAVETSDLAVAAVERLFESGESRPEEIECMVVVTQNPDGSGLPHTSAIIHHRLTLPESCAVFDISLGCSGWVHALSVLSAFMDANSMTRGLVVTADPYSKIIAPTDRDTSLLFGDAAAATLLSDEPRWSLGRFDFGTRGDLHESLAVDSDGKLRMNGRAVFNFSAMSVPKSIRRVLERNGLALSEIDRVVLHQGSKYIVDIVGKRIGAPEKTEFYAQDYGNAVSSSIPIILETSLRETDRRIVVAGFGVGLAWATTLLERI